MKFISKRHQNTNNKYLEPTFFIDSGHPDIIAFAKEHTQSSSDSLCEKFGVKPLEFDGIHDSVFHPFDEAGSKHMEYLRDYGDFEDLPFRLMTEAFHSAYPHLFGKGRRGWPSSSNKILKKDKI